jgi:glyoxylase-like metal-dependent hydrolase (beta-lactamase superfamily II)
MIRLARSGRTLLAAALLAAAPLAALAEAPMQKTQAPGFHRMMVGDTEVTVLSDGTIKLPVLQLLRGDRAKLAEALKRGFLTEQVETSVNAFLVNTGSKLVLIDTGAGQLFGPTVGQLLANLRAAGYTPEQVDEVYITHLHGDHVGGVLAGTARAFPNATLRLDKREADYWLSEANMAAAPAEAKRFFEGAMLTTKPYIAAGRMRPFEGSTELVPGVRAVSTYGHTPGHTIYTVESKGEKLVLWGDLMHVAAVQFDDPSVVIQFDSDNAAAMRARMAAYDEAAKNGWMVGAAHLSFPGVGRLRANGNGGYTFVPLNYSTLK